jgi:hypothetical protein
MVLFQEDLGFLLAQDNRRGHGLVLHLDRVTQGLCVILFHLQTKEEIRAHQIHIGKLRHRKLETARAKKDSDLIWMAIESRQDRRIHDCKFLKFVAVEVAVEEEEEDEEDEEDEDELLPISE